MTKLRSDSESFDQGRFACITDVEVVLTVDEKIVAIRPLHQARPVRRRARECLAEG